MTGHLLAARLPADVATPLVIATHLYAILLAAGLTWLAAAIGHTVVRRLVPNGTGWLERWLFATALGFGLISVGVLGLGLAGLLTPPALAGLLGALAVLARRDLRLALLTSRWAVRLALRERRRLVAGDRSLAIAVPLIELLLILLLLNALAPPTSYDPLMYHLHGARRFLELGRLAVLPDVQQANMPFAVDLLYLVGLAFGSDELANVLHLTFALLVTAAVFSFGRALIDARVGLIAALIHLSGSLIAVYGTVANVDYGLALFDFLAVYALVRWHRSSGRGWLLVAGALVGMSLSSKYLGGVTALGLGGWLVWACVRRQRGRRWSDAAAVARILATFGLPALLIAAPWYVKNALWLGSPVWPLLAPGDPPLNIAITPNANLGRGIVDYLLLPLRAYLGEGLEYPLARPPLLLLVVPLYALVPRKPLVTGLLALAALHLFVWSQGAHVVRYLTGIIPVLSVVAAYVLVTLARRHGVGSRVDRLVNLGLVVGLAISPTVAFYQVATSQAFWQTVGLESREAYLLRSLPNQPLVSQLNRAGDDVRGVLLIGDRRAYYVQAPTWVDVSLGAFETLATAPDEAAARAYLDQLGVSHVLVSEPDLAWHARFDPQDRIVAWWARFERTRAAYLEPEAAYFDLTLYRVTPARADGSAGLSAVGEIR